MALVAYDNSDSSDYEDEDDGNCTAVVIVNKFEALPQSQITSLPTANNDSHEDDGPSLFNLLPQPSAKKPEVVEEDDEFLHKKEDVNVAKPKAKITVPSLSDFKDVETSIPVARPKTSNGKKSGLLSMLPQPRNGVTATTKSLIPNVLKNKLNNSTPKATVPVKKPKVDTKPVINDSDESDGEEVVNDFFSINKPVDLPEELDLPLDTVASLDTVKETSVAKSRGIESFFKKDVSDPAQLELAHDETPNESEASSSGYENSNSNEVALDEEAIMKLCGTRGKRKREDIQIVDVNQEEVLANAREWLLKGLMDDTTKRVSASKKKGHEPTSQQRRKHQITYLAHQAKANEAELQNQWANNRMSKRKTQAKYGF